VVSILCIIFVIYGYCILFNAHCYSFIYFFIGIRGFVIVSTTGNV
jgi:hypothetical protein